MKITVAYATQELQIEMPLEVSTHCTVALAIRQSQILQRFPEIYLPDASVGIFGERVRLDTVLQAGDRVEIYRPLLVDPKEARRARAMMCFWNRPPAVPPPPTGLAWAASPAPVPGAPPRWTPVPAPTNRRSSPS